MSQVPSMYLTSQNICEYINSVQIVEVLYLIDDVMYFLRRMLQHFNVCDSSVDQLIPTDYLGKFKVQ